MKKLIIFISLLLCAGFAFAADVQTALKETAEQFSASLKPKSVVAIIGIHSESPVLSDFMLDELTLRLVQLKKLTIADRANLEAIKKEMSFQLSGEVGDESIQQLGAKIGAETVIQGTLKQLGKSARYTLTIRALDVTTAAVTDMYRANVELNEIEAEMLGVKAVKKAPTQYSVASVGFQNLLFGLGSYRTGHPGDGAVLTVGHLVGWSFLFAGLGVLLDDNGSPPDPPDRDHFGSTDSYNRAFRDYEDDLNRRNRIMADKAATGLGLMISGVLIEVGSIIYGFVMPAVHLKRARANAIAANDTGFKFNLAYTSSGDIAPQLSYKIRY
ncbi:hypothetical protein ABK01_06390 [Treponema sp. OMZ 305]|uniref:CsgG/HfaB family protein n=1 Tax=Treponema sp. OMZ 305 TaxID=1659192 RepID=UPI0020A3663E|nr:CsgG/HfaB family protein [Treponema sp. OMZ 305]UTC57924.1 hypothetical protein ABK01_06390 [Treponema sp. OMZ 305]